jgi:hypothetical protein
MHKLRYRQVHLDFHTSPHIPAVGAKFDKTQWQDCLQIGHVNSITLFSKCHHGWSYHPTKIGRMHPSLDFDLLGAQIEACKEIGVNTPIYLSAGVDCVMGEEHPEWREFSINGHFQGWGTCAINKPGFTMMCFNTPYLDYLCDQIREAVTLYSNCNGVFLDIIFQSDCCCKWCLKSMNELGLDADNEADRKQFAEKVLERYYKETTAACRCNNPDMPVFHNSGHVTKGNRRILQYVSHLELESLPTGGWGYDHFAMSAKYAQKVGLDFLGMTGKFHTSWGEFGGYKHPNALRYECAAMIAHGAKCGIGDQLHPSGEMDRTTYAIIGAAYAEVEKKEPWCDNVTSVADVAVLSSESENGDRAPDTGAGRILLEGHVLFDLIDRQVDISPYKLLILPDNIVFDDELKTKVDAYLENGGKVLASGRSGLRANAQGFAIDVGAEYVGESPFQPDYLDFSALPTEKGSSLPAEQPSSSFSQLNADFSYTLSSLGGECRGEGDRLAPWFVRSPLVMYTKSHQVRPITAQVLVWIRNPYFNRTWRHFCSHQHAPAADLSGYPAAIRNGNVVYLAHPVFSHYYATGAVAHREYVLNAIRLMLGEDETLLTNLPSTARVTLMKQADQNRYVLHLLYANTIARGAPMQFSQEGYVWDSKVVEVIEELLPLRDAKLSVALPENIERVTLEPQSQEIEFKVLDGRVEIAVDEFVCHQMVVLHYS